MNDWTYVGIHVPAHIRKLFINLLIILGKKLVEILNDMFHISGFRGGGIMKIFDGLVTYFYLFRVLES